VGGGHLSMVGLIGSI